MSCTIYLLKNNINGKIYIGQTWLPLNKRMGPNGSNYSNSPYIHNAIQKYGANSFSYIVLATTEEQEVADKLEAEYIIQYDSRNPDIGYNLKEGGSAGKHSEETKQKISANAAKFWLGKELSDEVKIKIGISKTGYKHTEEWKEENSIRTKAWHAENVHPMLGQHHTEEAKAKISESTKGKKRDPESVKKSAEARKMSPEREQAILKAYNDGIIISEIEIQFNTSRSSIYRVLKRNNISRERENNSWLGKKHSEETLDKMSKARKKYWEEK